MAPRDKKESWFQRNVLWMAPVGCLGLIGIVVLAVVGGVMGIKSTFIFSEGVALAAANPEVVEALGEPIEARFGFSGSLNYEEDGTGDADAAIPIKGPDGEATLHVVATRIDGEWRFDEAEVELPDREDRIDLLVER